MRRGVEDTCGTGLEGKSAIRLKEATSVGGLAARTFPTGKSLARWLRVWERNDGCGVTCGGSHRYLSSLILALSLVLALKKSI